MAPLACYGAQQAVKPHGVPNAEMMQQQGSSLRRCREIHGGAGRCAGRCREVHG